MLWSILIVICVIAAIVILAATIMERRRWRECVKRFMADRVPMTDDEFLRRLGCSEEHRAPCLACRSTLADLGNITPELIHPEDSMEALFSLQYDGGDPFEFQWELEDGVGIKFDNQFLDGPKVRTFADLVRHVIAHVKSAPAGAASASEPRTGVRGRGPT